MRSGRVSASLPGAAVGMAIVAMMLAGCGSNSGSEAGSSAGSSVASSTAASGATSGSGPASGSSTSADPKTATSAADFGGMDGLVAAAKAEGKLNVIALPPDWANYGEVIKAFQAKYPEIQIDQQQPNSSSAQEMLAALTNKGTDKAPDVFDLSQGVANDNVATFAPYRVASFDKIPTGLKATDGAWVNDYAGIMAVGYNADKFGDLTSLDQLKDPKFKGAIALNGNPNEAGAAFNGVVMAALANGGSADDISAGITFFADLKNAGNFLPIDPTPATIESGQTGVVFDWSYNQAAAAAKLAEEGTTWKIFVPDNAAVGAYYVQAINADAPHPAAARLWEEFLYTPEAQNLWIKGGAKPVLYDAMAADGTVDKAAEANLPKTSSPPVMLTDEQTTKAKALLKDGWAAVGG